jgi:hypothetical protein
MDSKGQFGLIYTEDFSAACAIKYLKREEVLQYFINRVSFYAFNGGEMEAIALWATRIILDCKEYSEAEVVPLNDRRLQRISIKYISLLSDLVENTYHSTVDKMKESFNIMQEWEAEMMPLVDFPKTFYLDEERFVILTFDFNLLCRMNGLNPQQVLQYFVDMISLARERALKINNGNGADACMSLFGMMTLSKSMKQHKLPLQQDIEQWYQEQLPALDEKLKLEPDLQLRISAYREFYAEWYHTLRRNLN